MIEEIALALSKTELFGFFGEDALRELAEGCTVRTVDRGEYLFEAGVPGKEAFVVLSGLIRVEARRGGRATTVGVAHERDSLGEIGLADDDVRVASGFAISDSTVIEVPRAWLMEVINGRPELVDAFVRGIGARLRQYGGDVIECLFLDLEGRVARLLLKTAGDTDRVDIAQTQAEIAAMVDGSRQRVNQVLVTLETLKLIAREGSSIQILDRPGLMDLIR